MTTRALHIAAYDVSDPRRLRDALKLLKGFASGRQKSVFECFLTEAEKQQQLAGVYSILDSAEDRFILVRLDPRSKVRTLGKAVKPADPPWRDVGSRAAIPSTGPGIPPPAIPPFGKGGLGGI
jgi:CRISPR-associated protein Cas2